MNNVEDYNEHELEGYLLGKINWSLAKELKKNENIYIYGAGNAGATVFHMLTENQVHIMGFIDKNAESIIGYQGLPVYTLDQIKGIEDALIIISLFSSQSILLEIKEQLLQKGAQKVSFHWEAYNSFLKEKTFLYEKLLEKTDITVFQGTSFEKIKRVFCYFEDVESRRVYLNFLKVLLENKFESYDQKSEGIQYFPDDICFSKGYNRFVDCGSYDGDTILDLFSLKGKVEKLVLFEPDKSNYQRLEKRLSEKEYAEEVFVFPYAIGHDNEIIRFTENHNSTSAIDACGESEIQCVTIDSHLSEFNPSFIKMDIEGSEYNGLIGAKEIIKNHSPDLAISVYHKIEDMWEIPILIKAMNQEYSFYLRYYGKNGLEVILYATLRNKEKRENIDA